MDHFCPSSPFCWHRFPPSSRGLRQLNFPIVKNDAGRKHFEKATPSQEHGLCPTFVFPAALSVKYSRPQVGNVQQKGRTDTDPATTQMPPTVPPSVASAVPASSRTVREVHPGRISVPIEVPTTLPGGSDAGQSPFRFAALTEIDPMEDDPHHARVVEAPRPRLRLMSQVSDIMAVQHVSGSDTESLDGASEREMFWWMIQKLFHRALSCQGQSLDEG